MSYTNQLCVTGLTHLFNKDIVEAWMNEGKEYYFKKGDFIENSAINESHVFLVKKGSARIFHLHEDGKECVIGLIQPGDFIDLLDIFTHKNNAVLSRALTDVTVAAVSKKEIRKIVEETPELAMALLEHFSFKIQEMIEILEQVGYGKVEERLIYLFKKLGNLQQGQEGWYPLPTSLTHQDIAGMIASSRETVTLLINKLLGLGVLKQSENRLWINIRNKN
ncbi:Crp/Fnr family transcriptional regulator [Desulfitobacterium sp.]|uniref:Crp/Fnr family transcriptional regulator n=1 Tax=Desulfitobacterium sp. TaxID=49981 RepID=UPI002B2032F1|nr:Crp/Fnr family transcriptional regulator [Desulfitobacterium sp.]MEA4900925.1 Crp/Fnr family transcriptional regulator [Desulfitobacterium sp.]